MECYAVLSDEWFPMLREDFSVLVFCSMQSDKNNLILDRIFVRDKDVAIVRNVKEPLTVTHRDIPEEWNLHVNFVCNYKTLPHVFQMLN
jgi:hypothetical protein